MLPRAVVSPPLHISTPWTCDPRPARPLRALACAAVALDEPDDAEEPGIPLPAADRVWRHPTEIAAEQHVAAAARRRRRRRERTLVGLSAAFTGAGAVLLVLAAIGEFSDTDHTPIDIRAGAVEQPASEQLAPVTTAPPFADVDTAATTMGAVARVSARDGTDIHHSTGIFLPHDGYLLTTATAVRDAEATTVWLNNGVEIPAVVIGMDVLNDVAVLEVLGRSLPQAVLGSAAELRPGDRAVVVDVSRGLTSVDVALSSVVATNRNMSVDDVSLYGLVQFDLLDGPYRPGIVLGADGELIGLVLGPESFAGYALPIEWAMRLAEDLIEHGSVHHAWLGVEGVDLRPDDADTFGTVRGARVMSVSEGSPADAAGLQVDDVVIGVEGRGIESMSDLVLAVRMLHPGDVLAIRYLRNGAERRCSVVLAASVTAPPSGRPGTMSADDPYDGEASTPANTVPIVEGIDSAALVKE